MLHRLRDVAIALGILAVTCLGLAACGSNPNAHKSVSSSSTSSSSSATPSASASATPSASPTQSVVNASDKKHVDDGKATVVEPNGATHTLPLVSSGALVMGDSTHDPRTPATYAQAQTHGPLTSWSDAYNTLNGMDWYTNGVNVRKGDTGFGWNDVKQFAQATDIDARVIVVYRSGITDAQARAAARKLIGTDADTLPIAHEPSCIENTRSLEQDTMSDFLDCHEGVRVILARIVFKDGKPFQLDPSSGIFVDCFNLTWIPKEVTVITCTVATCGSTVITCTTCGGGGGGKGGCVPGASPGSDYYLVGCHWVYCNCHSTTQVQVPVQEPGYPVHANPSAPVARPSAQPTVPVNTTAPAAPRSSGYNGGGTSNPIVSGAPTTGDTGTHGAAPSPGVSCDPFNPKYPNC